MVTVQVVSDMESKFKEGVSVYVLDERGKKYHGIIERVELAAGGLVDISIYLDDGYYVRKKEYDVFQGNVIPDNKKESQPQESTSVEQIYSELLDTYKRKNHDYGNSFGELYEEVGMPYAYGHIKEKIMRVKQLMESEAMVNESMEDSLLDCANYCVMWVSELRKRQKNG